MRTPRPPRAARALLELLLSPIDSGAATGDLDEEYTRYILPERGRLRANAWYWRQVLLSIPRLAERPVARRGLGSDIRQAVRFVFKRPTLSLTVIATLGLALGINTAVFAVVDAVLLEPLPYEHPERLVRPLPNELFFINSHETVLFQERMSTLASTAAWSRTLFLFDEGVAEEVRGARVSWNHFDMLGARALLGRTFAREDAAEGDGIVLSHGLWVRRFGADPSIVGRPVQVFGEAVTVLGVMVPEHVPLEFDWQAWSPMPLDPAEMEGRGMVVNGRLRDGVTLEQSREEMRRVLGDIWVEGGDDVSEEDRAGMNMVTLERWLLGDASGALTAVGGAVIFLLLLACANVANLLLVHGDTRSRELAVRAALGGSRARVSRQLSLEILFLCSLGGLVGFGAAALSKGWLLSRLPEELPRLGRIGLTPGVAGYALASVLLAALLVGLVPVLRSTEGSLGERLAGGRGTSAGRRQLRLRGGLVALETALAVLLVSGAGLMLRSLASLRAVEAGFDAEAVVTLRPSPPATRYPSGPPLEQYYAQLGDELARLPGVGSVGAIQFLPMTSGGWWTSYRTEETVSDEEAADGYTAMRVVRDGYFETMGIRLVRGRLLAGDDFDDGAPTRVLVNEAFVREVGGDPVGRSVYIGGDLTQAEVVGVVGDVRQADLRTDTHAEAYTPFAQAPWRRMHMVLRADGDPAATIEAARAAAVAVDPAVPLEGPRRMTAIVARTTSRTTLVTSLLTLFGFVGLALGGIGTYGVAAQAVAERRREIGIRMALGAEGMEVAARTVASGLVPVLLGAAAGLAGALGGGRLLEGLLFGVTPTDVPTFLTGPSVLVLVALVALAIPAFRAGSVDPVRTLRDH